MRGLTGHLHLTAALDSTGRTSLREQSFRAPMHLSKPHHDEGALVVNVINPTAGLLAGDRIECRVRVETGARLMLTTPSASRAHCCRDGHAEQTQKFEVAAGGFLESWPELFIPQGGARYRQHTTLEVEEGGELLFFETFAPGRVAMGEAWAFAHLDWETEVFSGGELTARERYQLTPESESVQTLRAQFPTAYYASCFVLSPALPPTHECWARIYELHEPEAWIGSSPLSRGGCVIKVVASGSVRLRRQLAAIRRTLYGALGRPIPSVRRIAGVG